MAEGGRDPFQSLRHREFRAFMAAMLGVFMAAMMQSTVLGIQVYETARATRGIGDAALSVGYVGLAEALPFLSLTLVGGWASDRMDRRTLSLLSFGGILAGGLALLALSRFKTSELWPFYAVQALAGVARAFFRPASVALGTELVPKEHYANAATWRSTAFHLATVAGPALGALLYAKGGASLTYGVLVVFMLVGLVGLLRLSPRPRRAPAGASMVEGFLEGCLVCSAHLLLVSALRLGCFAGLFGGRVARIPAFAMDVLHVGAQGVGLLRAAPALGAILMGLALARLGMARRAGGVLLTCVALFGVTWILFALSKSFLLSALLLAAGGALDNISVVLRGTLVQVCTPPDRMGRVAAVNSFFIGSSNELGAFESGLAARFLGLVPSVVFGGCMTLLTVGLTAWRAPQLRRLDRVG